MSIFAFLLLLFSQPSLAGDTRIIALGDSITEGYGVTEESAYPFLLEKSLKSHGHPAVVVVNSGISGSTSASGPSRLKWVLKNKPDLMILALGGNDGLRGEPVSEMKKNLESVIKVAQDNHIRVVLAGMKIPMNYGEKYRKEFEAVYPELARAYHLVLIPFLLEGVGGNPKFTQADGIHPNEAGHAIIAKTVEKYLEPLL